MAVAPLAAVLLSQPQPDDDDEGLLLSKTNLLFSWQEKFNFVGRCFALFGNHIEMEKILEIEVNLTLNGRKALSMDVRVRHFSVAP